MQLVQKLLGFWHEPIIQTTPDEYIEEVKSIDANVKSIDSIMKDSFSKAHIVWFFADWCGHCRNMQPLWDELKTDDRFEWCGINCSEDTSVASKYDVRSFPTIKAFKNGKDVSTFSDSRTVDNFRAFLSKI